MKAVLGESPMGKEKERMGFREFVLKMCIMWDGPHECVTDDEPRFDGKPSICLREPGKWTR
jgi:hypothetical protein